MDRLRAFVKTAILGGVAVVLPVAIFAFVFLWIFRRITDAIQPLTDFVVEKAAAFETIADLAVILFIVLACFLIGLLVRTRAGAWFHGIVEERLLKAFPGYNLIKETVLQFLGAKRSPFSTVALVRLFDSSTRVTAFVTDTHEDGTCTVFVPTGPNPTSGQIFHVPGDCVTVVDVPVEQAMRSILSCGAGSGPILEAYHRSGLTSAPARGSLPAAPGRDPDTAHRSVGD